MDFASYTDWSVRTAVDLANSRGSVSGRGYLRTPEDLRRFMEEHQMQPPPTITEQEVEEVHRLRDTLRAVFEAADEQERARLLNHLLADAGTLPQITNHDGDWHFHYVPMDAPITKRLASLTAMGLGVVLSEFGGDRLGLCSAHDCRDVYVDTSRNRSRRYCADSCASRTNVAAYRARHKRPSRSTEP